MVGSTTSPNFHYGQPLRGRRVRLLQIEPVDLGDESATLVLRLAEHDLDSAEFEALSYVWGSSSAKVTVRCNGQSLRVGQSLYEALCEFRSRGSTSLMWADAVCINQADNKEKTHQVRLMRDIYAAAQRTVIWLGPEKALDSEAIGLANKLFAKCGGIAYSTRRVMPTFLNTDFEANKKGFPEPANPLENVGWKGIFNIITHPWFSRIWVVQELLVSHNPIVWRGSASMDPNVFLWLATQIGNHRDLYSMFGLYCGNEELLQARGVALKNLSFRLNGPISLWDTMRLFVSMEATDPRDRIFALVGISLGAPSEFVDYNRSFREVATRAGILSLFGTAGDNPERPLTTEGLDTLAYLALPNNKTLGIPTWVPDMISKPQRGLTLSGVYRTQALSKSKLVPREEYRPIVSLTEEEVRTLRGLIDVSQLTIVPEKLDAKAVILDQVATVARRLPVTVDTKLLEKAVGLPGDMSFRDMAKAHSTYQAITARWICDARLLADPSLSPADDILSGGCSFEAFWRTLVYNRDPRDSRHEAPAPPYLALSFGYWFLLAKFLATPSRKWDLAGKYYQTQLLKPLTEPFARAYDDFLGSRDLFVSNKGRIGWAPYGTKAGDKVGQFWGNRIPFIARDADGGHHEYLGSCYFHGLMDGEAWDWTGVDWDYMTFI